MNDQERISPYNINPRENFSLQYQYKMKQESDENIENIQWRLLVDPIPNSLHQHHKYYMVASEENFC